MRDSNKLDCFDYVSDTFVWWLSATILYRIICFKHIYGINEFQSKLFFWALTIAFVVVGLAVTVKKRRNHVSLMVNTFLPLAVHTIVSTFRYIPTIYTVALSVAAVLSAVYFSLVVFKKVRNRKFRGKIIFKRVGFALLGMRTIIFVILFAVTAPVCSRICLGYGLVSADAGSAITETDEGESDPNRYGETLLMLHEDTWKTLSVKEKMNVLEEIKEEQRECFGISYELYLCAEPLEEGTLGTYNHIEHKITIDAEHLKSSDSRYVLRTLLHESMHAYQHRCAELYGEIDEEYKNMPLFNDAAKYKQNLDNYVSSDDDSLGYYAQLVEVNARDYAELMTEEYFSYIEAKMNEGEDAVG